MTPTDFTEYPLNERHIAIVGENWSAMLGHERAKYLTPKVGIFVHADNGELRDSLGSMQVISGNVELAMFPLLQIMEVMIEPMRRAAQSNDAYKYALTSMELAMQHVKNADAELAKRSAT